MKKPPWRRLASPHAADHVLAAMEHVVRTGRWDAGPRVRTLEARLARELGVPPEWVLATSSCTAALTVAGEFLTRELPEVRVCPLTYASTWQWALNAGPVRWVDCDEEGWPVGPVDVAVELWGRGAAIAGVNTGQVAVLDAAHRLLDSNHTAYLRDGWVAAVCYSFNCQKEAPCLHGGAVVSPHVTDDWRAFIHCGTVDRRPVLENGIKGYLNDPLAEWIWHAVKRRSRAHARRQKVLSVYQEFLGSWLMTRPGEASGHLAVVRLADPGHRKLVQTALNKHRVEHSVHYPIPEWCHEECPGAVALSERIVSIPCHDEMTERDAARAARVVAGA